LPPFATGEAVTARQLGREIPLLILTAVLIVWLFRVFVAQAFYIPSGSMLPQLQINDRVVVSRVSYRVHDPRRGDIVVFDAPITVATGRSHPSNPLAWTVNFVGVNVGLIQPSTDEYIKRVIGLPGETIEGRNGRVFVNGARLDEPYLPPGVGTAPFGPITVPEGYLWVMGDNRGNSSDSRVFGPVPIDTVIGRAILRIWPLPNASFL
jgi:signal peptidase I